LHDALEEVLAAASAAHWVEVLTDAGVPAGLVNDVAEALAFADRLGLAPVVEVPLDRGLVTRAERAPRPAHRSVANPIGIAAAPARYHSPPPKLDADHGADWHPHPAPEGTDR
jgi:crotonobetainyl-CoA:carnitine CoA-transferase CaiB-like acyl-CoA transferase